MIKKVVVTGISETRAALKNKGIEVKRSVGIGLKFAARPIYKEAYEGALAIKRTGVMASELEISDVYMDKNNLAIDVGFKRTRDTLAWYAHFPEFGTVHSAAKPFMRPALDNKNEQAKSNFRLALKRSVGGL